MTTRNELHAAWVTAFDAHVACLNERRLLSIYDDESVPEWETREAALGAAAEQAGAALARFHADTIAAWLANQQETQP